MVETYKQEQQRQLGENDKEKLKYSGSSSSTVNNHHHIPRQDFDNYINGGNPNKGAGNNDSGGN